MMPRGSGYWVVANRGQRELGPVRFALGDLRVEIAEEPFTASGETCPAGSLIIERAEGRREEIERVLAGIEGRKA